MINVNKLKGKIVENGMTVSSLAEKMGIDKATLYRKLNNNAEALMLKEASAIVDILHLSIDEATAIFFSQFVA